MKQALIIFVNAVVVAVVAAFFSQTGFDANSSPECLSMQFRGFEIVNCSMGLTCCQISGTYMTRRVNVTSLNLNLLSILQLVDTMCPYFTVAFSLSHGKLL